MKWSALKFIIPLVLFTPVIWQNFFSISPISVKSDFTTRTPWFEYLLPVGRTQRTAHGFKLQAEPVYFDLRLPLRLERLRLVLIFTTGAERARVGIQDAPGWNYYFPPQVVKGNAITVLAELFTYTPGYRQRFIISAPDLATAPVELMAVEVIMTRHEFYWQWIYDKTINRYKLWVARWLAPLQRNTQPFLQSE